MPQISDPSNDAPTGDVPSSDVAGDLPTASRGGLRRTLFLGGGAVIAGIGLVAGILILGAAKKILDQQANDQISDNAARTSRLVEQSVLERRREMELLATMPWLVELAQTGKAPKGVDVNDALARFRSRSLFRHLILYDRTGKVLATTDPTDSAPPRATPWWREAMTRGSG
ncbi:MAG TPA: cache domain-containing protein, partial [Gemmatimonadales bacterium]|nr:cache domain-containing protein [Gemmatimonadales bacterium]